MKFIDTMLCAYCFAATMAGFGAEGGGTSYTLVVESPDKRVEVAFRLMDQGGEASAPCYSVSFKGKPLVSWSSLGLEFADSGMLRNDLRIYGVTRASHDSTYPIVAGRTSKARDHYNEATVSLEEKAGAHRRVDLVFRAYDDGVAFRYHMPKQEGVTSFTLAAEHSTFAVAGNPTAYVLHVPSYTSTYEFRYQTVPAAEVSTGSLVGLPLMFEYPDHAALAITEADLTDYAAMYLAGKPEAPGLLTSLLSPLPGNPGIKVKSKLPHDTPWRVLMIGENPVKLLESNLVYNLNPPCAIKDTSWIRPVKTAFPWWNGYELGSAGFRGALDTRTMKYYIDFCAEQGIECHSLDGLDDVSWYGDKCGTYHGKDITKSLPGIDLPEVIRYAKEKGVRLRLWLHWAGTRAYMEKAFPLYEKWGIEGVMVDFIERDDQEMVNFIHDVVALAARHHLTVTLHNLGKPTGLGRTYPNLMTYEGALNLEYNKWDPIGNPPDHELMVACVRGLAGPVDYHHGSFRHVTQKDFKPQNVAPVTIGTRAHQIARYVVYEDPLPMVADYPDAYRNQPGFELLVKMPVWWDETRVLNGEVGKYLTIARRHGKEWYVGTMGDATARELSIPLSFLGKGRFTAEIYADDVAHPENLAKLQTGSQTVSATDNIAAKLAPAGGHLVHLKPLAQ